MGSHHTAETDWLGAYVLGVAFCDLDDAHAVNQVLAVTSEARMLRLARDRVLASGASDPETRDRACRLLDQSIARADAARPGAEPVATGDAR